MKKHQSGREMTIRDNGSVRIQTINTLPSKTQQNLKSETDINNIMRKYHAGVAVTHLNKKQGSYLDLSTISDYQTSLEKVIQARESFASLPSETRKKFNNNPEELITFLSEPKNTEEAIILGLKQKPTITPHQELIKEIKNLKTETPPKTETKT